MVEKVLEFSGFSKLEMKFVLTGLLNICLILLESQYLMKVSRYFAFLPENQVINGYLVKLFCSYYLFFPTKIKEPVSWNSTLFYGFTHLNSRLSFCLYSNGKA